MQRNESIAFPTNQSVPGIPIYLHFADRFLCSYKSQSAFDLQYRDRQTHAEPSHYVEKDVWNLLKTFDVSLPDDDVDNLAYLCMGFTNYHFRFLQGGKVHLEQDESTGIANIILDNPKVKNAFTG